MRRLACLANKDYADGDCKRYIKRLRREFCHPFGRVPDWRNSKAERAVRRFALPRHAVFGGRAESGADTYAKLPGIGRRGGRRPPGMRGRGRVQTTWQSGRAAPAPAEITPGLSPIRPPDPAALPRPPIDLKRHARSGNLSPGSRRSSRRRCPEPLRKRGLIRRPATPRTAASGLHFGLPGFSTLRPAASRSAPARGIRPLPLGTAPSFSGLALAPPPPAPAGLPSRVRASVARGAGWLWRRSCGSSRVPASVAGARGSKRFMHVRNAGKAAAALADEVIGLQFPPLRTLLPAASPGPPAGTPRPSAGCLWRSS